MLLCQGQKKYSAIHANIFQMVLQDVFCGKTVTHNVLFFLKFCDLSKDFLCYFDSYAYLYVLISIVKSTYFVYLNPCNETRINVKIPTANDEPK